jgi:Enoyl-(Acyl carrier protein) reductase
VNVVAPGPVATDFGGGYLRDNPQVREAMGARAALGRVGEPDDIGALIAVLLADGTHWMTGQRIEVSGARCSDDDAALTRTLASWTEPPEDDHPLHGRAFVADCCTTSTHAQVLLVLTATPGTELREAGTAGGAGPAADVGLMDDDRWRGPGRCPGGPVAVSARAGC